MSIYRVLHRYCIALLFVLTVRPALASDTDPVTVPIQLHGIYVYVDLRIDDKPATFIIDTGASANIVTPEAARRLGLVAGKERTSLTGGAGPGGSVPQTKIGTMTVGERSSKEQIAYILALPDALACDGLLGTPFLRGQVVTIDYERQRLVLTPAGNFAAPVGASILPLRFKGETPFIEAKADGQKGWFRIDTGAGNGISLFRTFVDKKRLREKYPAALQTPTGRAIGGLLYGELVRLKEFALGPFRFVRPVTEFSQQTQGTFGDRENAGNLGGEIWQRFTVTLDYGHNRVYLKPNALYNRPFNTPRTGLAVDTNNGVSVVIDVTPGSPGAEAGIVKGDVVLAVNDMLTTQLKPWELAALLRSEPGTKLRLRLQSADKSEREVTITLRDLL